MIQLPSLDSRYWWQRDESYISTVLKAQVECATGDETGAIVGGFVRLSGPLSQCRLYENGDGSIRGNVIGSKKDVLNVHSDAPMDNISGPFYAALFTHQYRVSGRYLGQGILLQSYNSEPGKYLRCGRFFIDTSDDVEHPWDYANLGDNLYLDPKECSYEIY